MDEEILADLAARLQRMRREVRAAGGASGDGADVVELDQSRVGRLSRMDALQGQAMSVAAQNRRRIELERIEAALQRIETGEFGECVDCGEPINIKRLQLDPAAPLCVDCAGRRERDAKSTV